jgi:bloom syndrome protein
MVSSPAPPRRKPAKKLATVDDGDEYPHDDFVVSDEDDDAFDPMPNRRYRREDTPDMGPPITIDERMAILPELHRVYIAQFVDAARSLEEKIRNKHSLRKPFFTEANLREMAIDWTDTLDKMMQIPDINADRVKSYGQPFVALVAQYQRNYNEVMNDHTNNRDLDKNHQNVIDLISDEEKLGLDEEDESAVEEAEAGSKYFSKSKTGSHSRSGNASGRNFPWAGEPEAKSSSSRGGSDSFRGKGRGGKRAWSRKSNGSASGQSSSGVSKRKFSGGSKKPRGSKAGSSNSSKGSDLMRSFGNNGGGGMGGGGIGMMPT